MLSIASIQTTAFAGSAVGASKVSPQMQFGGFGKKAATPAKPAFAYGLPGNFNALGGGELNWDPAGFLEGKSELEVNRYRECELTHGRVGMLASLGFLVQGSSTRSSRRTAAPPSTRSRSCPCGSGS